ncbi:hypothetical protein GCM10007854_29450 [Algimonas porphyrae]|uniref:Uncharacterized protein n=1 Tax=Algimonas porphyrae TaxID=1128113 RepID=A0ABQ5V392_9PROT|nr:hypothetical protein GCM10007854_29450 [Algimonas porphyrae]
MGKIDFPRRGTVIAFDRMAAFAPARMPLQQEELQSPQQARFASFIMVGKDVQARNEALDRDPLGPEWAEIPETKPVQPHDAASVAANAKSCRSASVASIRCA